MRSFDVWKLPHNAELRQLLNMGQSQIIEFLNAESVNPHGTLSWSWKRNDYFMDGRKRSQGLIPFLKYSLQHEISFPFRPSRVLLTPNSRHRKNRIDALGCPAGDFSAALPGPGGAARAGRQAPGDCGEGESGPARDGVRAAGAAGGPGVGRWGC